MAALDVLIGHATTHNRRLAQIIEGQAVCLVDHGQHDRAACHSDRILDVALRQQGFDGEKALENVRRMMPEPSGKITVIKFDHCKDNPI